VTARKSSGSPHPRGADSRLEAHALIRRCDATGFDFDTTEELEAIRALIGQDRATRSLHFGLHMDRKGFNVFALGPEEADKREVVRAFLEERAASGPPPEDLCYVNDFDEPHAPRCLRLPAGTARALARDVDAMLGELRSVLEAAFESEEYQVRRQGVQEAAGQEQQEAFEALQEKARKRNLALLRTPAGFVFAPVRDGDVLGPEDAEAIPKEEQEELEAATEELQEELQKILRKVPRQRREAREETRNLDREVAAAAVAEVFRDLEAKYEKLEPAMEHLAAVKREVAERGRQLLADEAERQQGPGEGAGIRPGVEEDPELRRYRVNVLVDHGESEQAPVVYEDHPTYQNLVGRVEYLPVMGALVTDFNLIKPGALHRANGGYLLLDAQRVLLQPFAWEGLKRALQSGQIRIESPREAMGMVSTVTLDPEPAPLEVKVVLLGSRLVYYILAQYDPDFADLFKVEADFDDRMDRTSETEALYARLVGSLAREEALRPFDRGAVARIIDESARIVGDAEKLAAKSRRVLDLIREADFWAGEVGADLVRAEHVDRAVEAWTDRSSRLRDRLLEEIVRDTIYIDTDGEKVGQVNGLSVLQLGDYSFGRPNRITARVRMGTGKVVDIEREVELGGPIHSKGVLILSSYLGATFCQDRPLALAASLVFEQSYSGVEGDSASSAELFALLSAIGGIPLRQSVAVTGSVNQHGQIQPIGGVNEKIEGFFDLCRERGLDGEQGVIIPASNGKHLMLRPDVVEAVEEGRFHVWAIHTAAEGMELLAGMPMGERDDDGRFPEGTVSRRVEERLEELAESQRKFAAQTRSLQESPED
jgi:lon-related putative ATP-dependent protease